MNPSHLDRQPPLALTDTELDIARQSTYEFALFEEFSFVRREAQAEADLAYEDWYRNRSTDSYVVYRAAQDRADAAQDALADWVVRIAA
jgi:hypothetical protein